MLQETRAPNELAPSREPGRGSQRKGGGDVLHPRAHVAAIFACISAIVSSTQSSRVVAANEPEEQSRAGDVWPFVVTPFSGKIAVNAKDSVPDWRDPQIAPRGAPNVLLILLDDVGFADTSTFGGAARTPVLSRLAAQGLRYNRFHTAGVCSPSRAALLSGRNQHRIGYGDFGGVGFPGYDGIWKKNAASMAEVLRRNGYSTAAFGKWHNTPYQDISPVGPFDRWPTGLGFEYFFGNLLGNGSQWDPILWRNTAQVPPSSLRSGDHLTTLIVDDAVAWLHTHESVAPDKPFFMYFAPEATHVPHQVPKEWIEKYRGKFDQGWDRLRNEIFARQKKLGVIPADTELTPRPPELPAWDSLSIDQKRLLAHQMEVYAAFVEHTDHEVGKLIQAVQEGPHADNTLILYIVGDNGTNEPRGGINGADDLDAHFSGRDDSVESQLQRMGGLGSAEHSNIYGIGWAWTGSTPFQWVKEVASHFGATRNPLIVCWPARIRDPGKIRRQFSYLTDIAATVYEAAGIKFPTAIDGVDQLPLDGISLLGSFDRADAPGRRIQYFEWEGNRAIYEDGWIAAARHFIPWVITNENMIGGPNGSHSDFRLDRWELYDVDRDFSEAHDLAARYPQKLKQLQDRFDSEARRNEVYPLGAGMNVRAPTWLEGRKRFVLYPDFTAGTLGLREALQLRRITADVELTASEANGVIVSWGGRYDGFVLYAKEDRLVYESHAQGEGHEVLTSTVPLPKGSAQLIFELGPDATGASTGHLYINGASAGEATINPGLAFGVVDVGKNSASPISDAYQVPFKFNGRIGRVTVELQ